MIGNLTHIFIFAIESLDHNLTFYSFIFYINILELLFGISVLLMVNCWAINVIIINIRNKRMLFDIVEYKSLIKFYR